MKKLSNYIFILVSAVFAVSFFVSCEKKDDGYRDENRHVLLMYEAGFNSLSSALQNNIKTIESAYVPSKKGNVLLVFEKYSKNGNYSNQTEPVLYRIYKNDGSVVREEVARFANGTIAADATTLNSVLNIVHSKYPAKSYGLVFSSHGTGWVPVNYYDNASKYDSEYERNHRSASVSPYSIGQEWNMSTGSKQSKEIDIEDFASAFPFKMDYIIFDACLMGSVEVAYSLRNVCDRLVFSPAEVISDGFNYRMMGERLLKRKHPDPVGVAQDFFELYDKQNGAWRSATISVFDCKYAEALAEKCADIFTKHRVALDSLSRDVEVQGYYTGSHHWFFDLRDIISHLPDTKDGMSDTGKAELARDLIALDNVLEKAVVYEAHTPRFLEKFDIKSSCGLSMYFPAYGSAYLNAYYKTLSWNRATALVL